VVLGLQAFGQLADAGPLAPGKALDVQQQVLQGSEASPLRGVFRKAQEAAQLVAKIRQGFEILFAGGWRFS
jgi:selenocysteine lyase/cysteine desulfurase